MDEALLKIVKEGYDPQYCIDKKELYAHTRYCSVEALEEMPDDLWQQVRHLYMIWDSPIGSAELEAGGYLSPDGDWLLIYGIPAKSAPEMVRRCGHELELLDIRRGDGFSADLSHKTGLRTLRVDDFFGSGHHILTGTSELTRLEELSLASCQLMDQLNLARMTEMKKLSLEDLGLAKVTGIGGLQCLRDLCLLYVKWENTLDLSAYPKLKALLIHCDNEDAVSGLSELRALETLSLFGTGWGAKLDVATLTKLRSLKILSNRRTLRQIVGLEKLLEMEELWIEEAAIREIPEASRGMKHLRRLQLMDVTLNALPDWLPELGLPFLTHPAEKGIIFERVEIPGVDMSIFNQPQDVILQWFEERKRGNTVPLNEVKVVFLGDGEAGKTHTIARLLAGGEKPAADSVDGKATPGIVIKDMDYTLDGKQIQVHYWDFGGQEILHSMHRMFLTERTLYVVIINARDDTQDDRARYWLHNIKSFAGTAPVLLVLNKIDQNPNASIDAPNLQKMYGGLKNVVRMSALEYSKEQFNAAFTNALLKQVQKLGTLGTLWPRSWLKLKSGLENMETHYIHGNDYEDLCDDCGVEQNREELLHWFNDLGVSFCYGGSAKLEDYVILKPEWLTNAIYIILFNKCPDTENGVIPHEAIYRMLKKPRKGQDPIRRVLKDVFYRPEEAEYVLDVIRKFRLSYKVREDAEFIPVLCQRESMAVAEEYEHDPDALEFQMSFDYLPDNVIHRLMVEMRKDLDIQNVWRTGARFVQQGTGLSAVVRSEGEVLRIFVRSDNSLHQPNTYLHILKGNIDQIIADMKLQKPFCEVIYKADGITEAFDYEDLIFAWQEGEATYRSKDRRRRTRYIPIQDILNQTGRTAEVELDKLRTDIITACMQLQGNSKFWDATEDEWNTYVRDALRNRDYLVNDQSFQGISGGEKKAGELDLDIRKDARIPWTIYEALKIKDRSKTAWNAHLEKLLDNYNPSGLNYLFLVTYVDCDKDSFQGIWDAFSEHIKWFNPGTYERLPSSFSYIHLAAHNNPNYMRAVRCTYDRAGAPTTVCHIFARMGR